MQPVDRRAFLRILSSAAVTATFAKSIEKAVAMPAHSRTGTIDDIEHIVFLMQENRAFDHYFGTLRGVRGYGDPRVATLPSGKSVWHQPDGSGYVLPYHPTAENFGDAFLVDTAHGWNDTQAAWNGGKYDQWIPTKGRATMAHYNRKDIPFHYALADAFTICDAYHCSVFGSTDPNRYHMWTGWVGNDGQGGGPVINNAEAGYDWSTYPERLERNDISWKIYQDSGVGLDAPGFWGWTDDAYIGNYGDNSLLYFHQYQNAAPGSALYEKARKGTNIAVPGTPFDALFAPLRQDVLNNKLPKVSWIVAPEAFSEHGNWPANYGAWYISNVLDALTANPEVWSKTALFITYDENDGFFDHLVPPTPPRSAAEGASTVDITNDIFPGKGSAVRGPYGLGVRVPMLVVSPWTKGGYVCSQTFDHTSLIQFIEKRFARRNRDLIEANITPWRRTVCGDLTSAFNFKEPNNRPVKLPETSQYEPQNHDRHPDYVPTVPANQSLPAQEHGVRPSRALPYELRVDGTANRTGGTFRIDFKNTGKAGACFQVRSGNPAEGPWTYTVEADKSLSNTWSLGAAQGKYDLSVFGPNGFFRAFKGTASGSAPSDLDVDLFYDCDDNAVVLRITNQARVPVRIAVSSLYGNRKINDTLQRGRALEKRWSLKSSFGWYDLTITTDTDASFQRRFAGRLETGRDTYSDPALGGVAADCKD